MRTGEALINRKWQNKKVNSKKENIGFGLSLHQFRELIEEARICAEDIKPKGYHLARYNDRGAYLWGNCRFIHYTRNIKEKATSKKSREASRNNLKNFMKTVSSKQKAEWGRKGGKSGGGHNKLTYLEINHRLALIETSGINLAKYGWVSSVAKLLKISHTQVRRFIEKHHGGEYFRRR